MRLLIKLEAVNNFPYDTKFFSRIQALIYSLIRDTKFDYLHNKYGFKFFTFSNIFPVANFKNGDIRNLIIASPNNEFLTILYNKFKRFVLSGVIIKIGWMNFIVKQVGFVNPEINSNYVKLVTTTPVVVRIPKKFYDKYDITYCEKNYIYWRPKYPLEAFIDMITRNLIKKYNEYYEKETSVDSIFQILKFRKEVVTHLVINREEYPIVGTLWTFIYTSLDNKTRELLKFALDVGIGERNTYGYGFLNIIKKY